MYSNYFRLGSTADFVSIITATWRLAWRWFGGSGELNTERRGLEKSLYNTTIVIAVIFALSILAILVVG